MSTVGRSFLVASGLVVVGVFTAPACSLGSKTIVNMSDAQETSDPDGGAKAGATGAGAGRKHEAAAAAQKEWRPWDIR